MNTRKILEEFIEGLKQRIQLMDDELAFLEDLKRDRDSMAEDLKDAEKMLSELDQGLENKDILKNPN